VALKELNSETTLYIQDRLIYRGDNPVYRAMNGELSGLEHLYIFTDNYVISMVVKDFDSSASKEEYAQVLSTFRFFDKK